MRSPENPTREDIREWAYTEGALYPIPAWDLILTWTREFDLYVELAADDECPNWDFFLGVLYQIVGEAVRTGYRTESKAQIEEFLDMTKPFPKYRFHLLRERAAKLMANPDTFDFSDWCTGQLVRQDLEAGRV